MREISITLILLWILLGIFFCAIVPTEYVYPTKGEGYRKGRRMASPPPVERKMDNRIVSGRIIF